MALANGVLVHGPRAWACAVRLPDGSLKVAAAGKTFRASDVQRPFLRGPARLLEAVAVLPAVRKRLPEAQLPFARPDVLAATLGSAVVVRVVRESRLGPAAQELLSGLLSVAPAAMALRTGDLAAYHGAEHVSIGSYEHGERRAKEHERCGSHLLGPRRRVPRRRRGLDGDLRVDGAQPGATAGEGAREARPRAPAPDGHRGAD